MLNVSPLLTCGLVQRSFSSFTGHPAGDIATSVYGVVCGFQFQKGVSGVTKPPVLRKTGNRNVLTSGGLSQLNLSPLKRADMNPSRTPPRPEGSWLCAAKRGKSGSCRSSYC